MKRLIEAIELIRTDMDDASLSIIGKMPPLVTVLLPAAREEARYYAYLRAKASPEEHLGYFDRSGRTLFRPDCLCSIAGIDVRLTSIDRIDEAVRRVFK